MMSRTPLAALLVVLLSFSVGSVACDAGTGSATDCRTAGQECAAGWTCEADASGNYECMSDSGGFATGDPNDPNNSADDGSDPTDGSGTAGNDGPPSTDCLYPFGSADLGQDFGQGCTSDDECAHGTCMLPGAEGNVTNAVFGFCTRGCDCDDAADAKLSSEDDTYHCVYPGGCFIGESQGAWRHAVLKCSTVEDCQAVDPRYTDCATTDSKTVVEDTCGSLRKVCQAHE
ncbi:MAG: hypothetical protein ACPGU1_03215 [Myxococcota bacterium]